MSAIALAPGLILWPGYLDAPGQAHLAREVGERLRAAPFFVPRMPRTGRPFSVRMTNFGPLGWVSDVHGYRYQDRHPETGEPWPDMPPRVLETWRELSGHPRPPQACLVNFYEGTARMGLHQDRDEDDLEAPVVSLSLGDTAVFRYGGTSRRDPTRSVRLQSGDALVLGGPARLAHHGVDRLVPGSSRLLPGGGRINLTLRRVTKP